MATSAAPPLSHSPLSPIFFFGAHKSHGFLSQFFQSEFEEKGILFSCCEQYMMYKKAIFFGDQGVADQILKESSPVVMKGLGRRVKGFIKEKWDKECTKVVFAGNMLKFQANPRLLDALLKTGDKELIEASPYDKIWGIGFSTEDAGRTSRDRWGQNLLGQILMKIREKLRHQKKQRIF